MLARAAGDCVNNSYILLPPVGPRYEHLASTIGCSVVHVLVWELHGSTDLSLSARIDSDTTPADEMGHVRLLDCGDSIYWVLLTECVFSISHPFRLALRFGLSSSS